MKSEMPLILIVIAQNWNLFHHFFKKRVKVVDSTGININKLIRGKFKLLKRISYLNTFQKYLYITDMMNINHFSIQ